MKKITQVIEEVKFHLCCQQNTESFMHALRQLEPSTHVPEQVRRGVAGRRGVPLLFTFFKRIE